MRATQIATVFTVEDGPAYLPRLVWKIDFLVYELHSFPTLLCFACSHVTALLLLIGKTDTQMNDVALSGEKQSCVNLWQNRRVRFYKNYEKSNEECSPTALPRVVSSKPTKKVHSKRDNRERASRLQTRVKQEQIRMKVVKEWRYPLFSQ